MIRTLIAFLLMCQGVVGGIDTILNHELIARLPERPASRGELGLHAVREGIYAALFGGLAWWEWHGAAALVIAALLAAEVIDTACDEFVENKTRVLPQNERVMHVVLTINLGLIIAVLAPMLLEWFARPTAIVFRDWGWVSWALSALALGSAAWAVRDCRIFTTKPRA